MKRELRTKSVGTKVSEAELRVMESHAERAGLPPSEWVRDVLLRSSIETGTLAAERPILHPNDERPMTKDLSLGTLVLAEDPRSHRPLSLVGCSLCLIRL
jgi:hypothetical protein